MICLDAYSENITLVTVWNTYCKKEQEKWGDQLGSVYSQTSGDIGGLVYDDVRGWQSSEWIPERFSW